MAAFPSLCLHTALRELEQGPSPFLQVTETPGNQHRIGEFISGPWAKACMLTAFASDCELQGSPETQGGLVWDLSKSGSDSRHCRFLPLTRILAFFG